MTPMSDPVEPPRIGFRKCSDIPDVEFLRAIDKCCDLRGPTSSGHPVTMATRWDVAAVLAGHPEDVGECPRDYPGVPEKVVMAKARRLDRRGLISGCGCGCRGDFEITPKGAQFMVDAGLPEPVGRESRDALAGLHERLRGRIATAGDGSNLRR